MFSTVSPGWAAVNRKRTASHATSPSRAAKKRPNTMVPGNKINQPSFIPTLASTRQVEVIDLLEDSSEDSPSSPTRPRSHTSYQKARIQSQSLSFSKAESTWDHHTETLPSPSQLINHRVNHVASHGHSSETGTSGRGSPALHTTSILTSANSETDTSFSGDNHDMTPATSSTSFIDTSRLSDKVLSRYHDPARLSPSKRASPEIVSELASEQAGDLSMTCSARFGMSKRNERTSPSPATRKITDLAQCREGFGLVEREKLQNRQSLGIFEAQSERGASGSDARLGELLYAPRVTGSLEDNDLEATGFPDLPSNNLEITSDDRSFTYDPSSTLVHLSAGTVEQKWLEQFMRSDSESLHAAVLEEPQILENARQLSGDEVSTMKPSTLAAMGRRCERSKACADIDTLLFRDPTLKHQPTPQRSPKQSSQVQSSSSASPPGSCDRDHRRPQTCKPSQSANGNHRTKSRRRLSPHTRARILDRRVSSKGKGNVRHQEIEVSPTIIEAVRRPSHGETRVDEVFERRVVNMPGVPRGHPDCECPQLPAHFRKIEFLREANSWAVNGSWATVPFMTHISHMLDCAFHSNMLKAECKLLWHRNQTARSTLPQPKAFLTLKNNIFPKDGMVAKVSSSSTTACVAGPSRNPKTDFHRYNVGNGVPDPQLASAIGREQSTIPTSEFYPGVRVKSSIQSTSEKVMHLGGKGKERAEYSPSVGRKKTNIALAHPFKNSSAAGASEGGSSSTDGTRSILSVNHTDKLAPDRRTSNAASSSVLDTRVMQPLVSNKESLSRQDQANGVSSERDLEDIAQTGEGLDPELEVVVEELKHKTARLEQSDQQLRAKVVSLQASMTSQARSISAAERDLTFGGILPDGPSIFAIYRGFGSALSKHSQAPHAITKRGKFAGIYKQLKRKLPPDELANS